MNEDMNEVESLTQQLHNMKSSADKNTAELVYQSVKNRAYNSDVMNPSNVIVTKTPEGARLMVQRK